MARNQNTALQPSDPANAPPRTGAQGDRHEQPGLKYTHEAAPLSTSGDIPDDAGPDGNGAGAPGALQTPKNHQSGVALGQREADARAEEDGKGEAVGEPATPRVRKRAPETGGHALEDEVGRHCQVDEL